MISFLTSEDCMCVRARARVRACMCVGVCTQNFEKLLLGFSIS